jgi:hypothetical protein
MSQFDEHLLDLDAAQHEVYADSVTVNGVTIEGIEDFDNYVFDGVNTEVRTLEIYTTDEPQGLAFNQNVVTGSGSYTIRNYTREDGTTTIYLQE